MSRPAVFIDRDGTLNVDVHHLHRIEDLALIQGAGEAVARLNAADCPVIVITNQSVIARGLLTEPDLAALHAELHRRLAACNAKIDAIYYCPHHPDYGEPPYRTICTCRKPAPGMLLRAAAEHDLDLARSTLVGDNLTDLQAAWAAGCNAALVRTGYGEKTWANADPAMRRRIDFLGRDLAAVVDWILKNR